MREYKFRGRSKHDFEELNIKKGDWIYGDLVRDDKDNFWIVGNVVEANDEYIALEQWIPVEPETVGQFTNLPDKNGKEIYEGDLIKTTCKYDDGEEEDVNIDCVCFKDGAFRFAEDYKKYSDDPCLLSQLVLDTFFNVEIIGNIHENPDLLAQNRGEK